MKKHTNIINSVIAGVITTFTFLTLTGHTNLSYFWAGAISMVIGISCGLTTVFLYNYK